jgi:transcriptional regulator CtsR
MFVIQNTNTIFKVEGDNKVAMFDNLLQVLSKRVNTSLSKTKMVITLLFEHLLISKTQIKEAEIVNHKIL